MWFTQGQFLRFYTEKEKYQAVDANLAPVSLWINGAGGNDGI